MTPVQATTNRQAGEVSVPTGSGPVRVDVSGSRRIPIVMEMVEKLSRATTPFEVQQAFADGLVQLDGMRGYISLSVRGLQPGEYKITRMHTGPGPMRADASDPWLNWSNLPTHRGGFLGEIIARGEPQLFHHLYLKGDPVLGDALAPFGSLMAIPLLESGKALNWSISLRHEAKGFSVHDMEETILRSNLGGATVRNVIMTKQLRDANEAIRREVEQIARIQRSLLPRSLPQIPGLSIATSYETFDIAGGDLYDLVELQQMPSGPANLDGWLAMLIADAAGHGPGSAVLAAMLNTLMHAYPRTGEGPGAVLEFANQHLCAKRIDGSFVTAFFAALNPKDRTLMYARAGHNPPLIKVAGAGGAVTRLDDVGGLPLGVMDDSTYENGVIQLKPGQTIVLYTDGITEAMNPNREMFGVEGIERALHECSGEPACVVQSITTALRVHEAGVRPGDDQTIVAVKVE